MSEQLSEDLVGERTLTALQRSIDHWQRVVDGSEIATGSDDCDLCEQFYPEGRGDWDQETEGNCKGCPVDAYTKGFGCIGTPCGGYFKHMEKGEPEFAHRYAVEELDFLKGLLPKVSP